MDISAVPGMQQKMLIERNKIAISGKSGCGNTTVGRLVAERTGLQFINFTFRNLAAEHNISFEEVLKKAAQDDFWDREIDTRQVLMARQSKKGCVLGSRLAIWMLEEAALKVYLKADAKTRVMRIISREGGDLKTVTEFTSERDRQDSERYRRLYGIDNDDYSVANMVIDAETASPEEIAGRITAEWRRISN
ncbi:MAG: cytidylate kinase family protein [Spirochaetaceae bacterium]|jgi:cytidylate kinase|nr:cytidylate kinase family protein [Spirochaetaceae bacterium]